MTPVTKRWLLGTGLLATLVLWWFAPQDEVPLARPKAPARAARPQSGPVTAALPKTVAANALKSLARPEQLQRAERVAASEVRDLFRSRSWFVAPPAPPPAPAPAPAPPAPPTAPALPFSYLGQIVEDQKVQVILARGERVLTIFVGDSIDANYKVESIKGGTLTLVYLPLNIKQTLATGASQ